MHKFYIISYLYVRLYFFDMVTYNFKYRSYQKTIYFLDIEIPICYRIINQLNTLLLLIKFLNTLPCLYYLITEKFVIFLYNGINNCSEIKQLLYIKRNVASVPRRICVQMTKKSKSSFGYSWLKKQFLFLFSDIFIGEYLDNLNEKVSDCNIK